MLDQRVSREPAIVTLPAEIDLTCQERAYDRLYAAFGSGAAVVIADFTATTFCDCSSLRGLITVRQRMASRTAQLRLVIRPGTAVSRVAELIDLDRRLPVYSSLDEAVSSDHPQRPHGSVPPSRGCFIEGHQGDAVWPECWPPSRSAC